jgi:hypothetical protein
VKVDNATYARIRYLVKEGSYASVENFVEIAVKNQLLLETEGKLETVSPQSTPKTVKIEGQSPSTFLRVPGKTYTQTLAAQPLEESIKSAMVWGQINRLAPAKFVLRILLNSLAASDDRSVDLKRFSAEVAEQATAFRLFAKKKDKIHRIRGEEIYVCFPERDPSSQQRFLNYFVGKAPLRKWTDSILTGLSLANIEEMEDGSTLIGLTEIGLKLALLHSPLIDDFFLKGKQIDAPLSSEEISLLIDHIKSARPGEYEFMIFTLDSVKKGADTPTKLRHRIFDFLKSKDLQIKLSEKVANTMQVGVVGRLVETRLLKIEKEAQKSKYLVTEKGEELIGKL